MDRLPKANEVRNGGTTSQKLEESVEKIRKKIRKKTSEDTEDTEENVLEKPENVIPSKPPLSRLEKLRWQHQRFTAGDGQEEKIDYDIVRKIMADHRKIVEDKLKHTLEHILAKAKPKPSTKVEGICQELQRIRDSPEVADTKLYKDLIKDALEELSPDTWQEYSESKIEFVFVNNIRKTKITPSEDHCRVESPVYKGSSPMARPILRVIELILEVEYEQKKVPTIERRATVMARVFEANEKLGTYGWDIQDYKLAEQFHNNYEHGIRRAFAERQISKETQPDELRKIGFEWARKQLIASVAPPEGVPKVFPCIKPAESFLELKRNPTLCKIGDATCNTMVSMSKDQEIRFCVCIMPNKEIYICPIYYGFRASHAQIVGGNHVAWAGEIAIGSYKLLEITPKSGHYRTVVGEEIKGPMMDFALETLRAEFDEKMKGENKIDTSSPEIVPVSNT